MIISWNIMIYYISSIFNRGEPVFWFLNKYLFEKLHMVISEQIVGCWCSAILYPHTIL